MYVYVRASYRCTFKVSTPGDRMHVAERLPKLMTEIERVMPIDWNTIVIHIYVFHTLDILCKLGPFSAANILDIGKR